MLIWSFILKLILSYLPVHMMTPSRPPLARLLVAIVQELVSRGERYLGCLWVSARRTSRQRE